MTSVVKQQTQNIHEPNLSKNMEVKTPKTLKNDRNKCPYCNFVYGCPRHLTPHVREKHALLLQVNGKSLSYKCLYCEQCCTRPRKILIHMQGFHPERFKTDDIKEVNKIECTQTDCLLTFTTSSRLKAHLASEHNLMFVIHKKKPGLDINQYEEHSQKLASGDILPWGKATKKENGRSACSLSTKFHLSTRIKACNRECWEIGSMNGKFTCGYCAREFDKHSVCVTHEFGHEIRSLKSCKDIKCSEYDERFTAPKERDNHQQDVHDKVSINENQCRLCGRVFTTPWYVKQHIDSIHHQKLKFPCEHCDLSFKYKSSLIRHRINQHAQPRKEISGLNVRSFNGNQLYNRKHNGSRRFQCQYCQRTFRTKSYCSTHEKIHTGLKTHQCRVCNKLFNNAGSLYNHLFRYAVHGELPKVRKYDGGASQKAFDETVRKLKKINTKKKPPKFGSLKKGQNAKISSSHTLNISLDTLAQVAGIVDGMGNNSSQIINLSGLNDYSQQSSEKLEIVVGDTVTSCINAEQNSSQMQIYTLNSNDPNAISNLSSSQEIVVIFNSEVETIVNENPGHVEVNDVQYLEVMDTADNMDQIGNSENNCYPHQDARNEYPHDESTLEINSNQVVHEDGSEYQYIVLSHDNLLKENGDNLSENVDMGCDQVIYKEVDDETLTIERPHSEGDVLVS